MRPSSRFRVAVAMLALALVVAVPAALADRAVVPKSDSLPWTDPNHQSPLEQLASQISSEIAKRPVRVYCNGETDWNALGAAREFDPNGLGGFVAMPTRWYPRTRTFADSSINAQLSSRSCWYLWQYAMAEAKPTKCATTITETRTVYETRRVKKRMRVKVRVNGKTVSRYRTVWTTERVPVEVTDEVPGPPAPCYGLEGTQPAGGWREYDNYAFAILVLAHESIHLFDFQVGRSVDLPFEARAQCWGMQLVPSTAWKLGAAPDDARAIAKYVLDYIYPRYQGTEYWSLDCRSGGPLDLSPGDGLWP